LGIGIAALGTSNPVMKKEKCIVGGADGEGNTTVLSGGRGTAISEFAEGGGPRVQK